MPFLAHTGPSPSGKPEPLEAHLQDVGRRAGEFAEAFEAADEAWIAGLLHDLGKYGDLFQRRLQGLVQRFKDSKLALLGSPHAHCVGGNRTSSSPRLLGAVPVEIEEALSMFCVLVLRLIVQPRAALKLAAQNKGNTLRGASGTAFRRLLRPGVMARKLQVT